jgi:hypothetical protein
MKKQLTQEEVMGAFTMARTTVATYIHDYGVKCATDVIFAGFGKEIALPVKIWYNTKNNLFCVEFSEHYMRNTSKKIQKLFIRYLVCANPNGTFKNQESTLKELKKIEGVFFEDTFNSEFLTCDLDVKYNMTCVKCHKPFLVDENSDLFLNPHLYSCRCGGELRAVNAPVSKKNRSYYTNSMINGYSKKTIVTDVFDDEYFANIPHTHEDLSAFKNFVHDKTRITKKNLTVELERVANEQQKNLLFMYNFAFPKQYYSATQSLKKQSMQYVMEYCEPTYSSNAKKKTTTTVSLNRADYSCSNENFEIIQNYVAGRLSSRAIKPLIINAVQKQDVDMVRALYKCDKVHFEKTIRYLKKNERKFIESAGLN